MVRVVCHRRNLSSEEIRFELEFMAAHLGAAPERLRNLFAYWAAYLLRQAHQKRAAGDWRTAGHAALASVAFSDSLRLPKSAACRMLEITAQSIIG